MREYNYNIIGQKFYLIEMTRDIKLLDLFGYRCFKNSPMEHE